MTRAQPESDPNPSLRKNPRDGIDVVGARVNNLKNIDVHIRRNLVTVVCGVSGSGKSSLAFDTLFAEGQRRYVETFSPYVRQFMDQIERPDVDRIDGMPPAIAIRQNANVAGSFSTVGTRTEIYDSLCNLFAAAGNIVCRSCNQPAITVTSDSAARRLVEQYSGLRAMLVFPITSDSADTDAISDLSHAMNQGYSRCVVNGVTDSIDRLIRTDEPEPFDVLVIADRVKLDDANVMRIAESIESTRAFTGSDFQVLIEAGRDELAETVTTRDVDGKLWIVRSVSQGLQCPECDRSFGHPTSNTLNFQSAAGACSHCEGTGQVSGMTFEKVVPDDRLSLVEGAIRPWTTPAYQHELDELLHLAGSCGIPVDRPFKELTEEQRRLIHDGVPEFDFGGLAGFHRWLVRNRYKKGVSVVLNRWRSWLPCPECHGERLNQTGGRLLLRNKSISDVTAMPVVELQNWFADVVEELSVAEKQALRVVIDQLIHRIGFLVDSGLGYLSLNRSLKTLSGGEAQRVILTAALGSGLINTLYVLDEPTCGLHPRDSALVQQSIRRLQQNGNTIVVVEHDPEFIASADEVVEIGPHAGKTGGEIVFQGSAQDLLNANTATGKYLSPSSPSDQSLPDDCRPVKQWLSFRNIRCHNINRLNIDLPLGVICAITGVSGSGKSSLIVDSVYPAVCRSLGQVSNTDTPGSVHTVSGTKQLSEIQLMDQSPVRASRRSIPATIMNCFDEIRNVLAATHEAKKRNFKPGMFSFNSSAGGRCEHCDGIGQVTVEMQFLADIQTTCEACAGKRFRADVLEVRFRDRNVDDILNMTAEEGFTFFHNQKKIQQKLNSLRQAGLGYLRLGQPVSTLSGGEAQRLKIASLLAGVPLADHSTAKRSQTPSGKVSVKPTLFILDEPSTGLHMQDVALLMKCLNHLVDIGHTVWVIEHDLSVIRHSDYIVEMGPGAGPDGGKIVRAGKTISMIKEMT